MKFIIVESPNKCQTISKYLDNQYEVLATKGHIRDLAISGDDNLGIECENHFKPIYEILDDKKEIVKTIKQKIKNADEIFLATDPDREGEAIAWHISEVLKLPKNNKRLEFHEITKEAIMEALQNPRTIDLNLVESQETRRILDRIIGFKLSKIIQKTNNLKSAGRVQSAVLKIIVDHEKKIKSFKPETYWEIHATLKNDKEEIINVEFYQYHNKKVKLLDEKIVDNIISDTGTKVKVINITEKNVSVNPKQPLTTSLLQQESIIKFNMSSTKISKIAQELYEGVKIGNEQIGLVTYIRTDSYRLSNSYIQKTKKFISDMFGEKFLKKEKNVKKNNNSKNQKFVQDAHEAIRPTDNNLNPEKIKKFLTDDQYKIYKLIYERTLSSLMAPKIEKVTEYIIGNDKVLYKTSKTKTIFIGFEKAFSNEENKETTEKENNFSVDLNDLLKIIEIKKEKKETKPPKHFSEAGIIKTMEKEGIGRPSTYSIVIRNLLDKTYIVKEKGNIIPTNNGFTVIDFLEKNFPNIVNIKFTANLENDLDSIKNGEENKKNIINKIYIPLTQQLENINKEKIGLCPECGHELKYKRYKTKYFIGCSNYPECKFTKNIVNNNSETLDEKCPECGSFLVKRLSYKLKKYFIGCSNYPKCKYIKNTIKNNETLDEKCPECGHELKYKRYKTKYFIGCSNYPKCKYIKKNEIKK